MTRCLPVLALLAFPCFSQPPYVTCSNGASPFRSRVISRRGLNAYAVTEARTDTKWGCSNIARLYVGAPGQHADVVYTLTPLRSDDTADSLLPIAWSLDGRWLAVEALYAPQSGSDAGGFGLLLYDAQTRRTKEINSDFSAAVSKIEKKTCDVVLRSVDGFNNSGKVMLTIADFSDEEGHTQPCVGSKSEWLFDPQTEHLTPAKK